MAVREEIKKAPYYLSSLKIRLAWIVSPFSDLFTNLHFFSTARKLNFYILRKLLNLSLGNLWDELP